MKSREKHDHRQDTSPPLMLSDRDMKPLEGLNWDDQFTLTRRNRGRISGILPPALDLFDR